MIDRHAAVFEFLKYLGDCIGLVQLNSPGSAAQIRSDRGNSLSISRWSTGSRRAITVLSGRFIFVEIKIGVLPREIPQWTFVMKVFDVVVVTLAYDHQVFVQLSG